jgi:large subunit ribosomal protein L11
MSGPAKKPPITKAVAKGGKKAIESRFKLQIGAGVANASPPLGPALGQRGVNIMEFCKQFNDKTQNLPNIEKGTPLSVNVLVYGDKSFKFIEKGPPMTVLIKKVMGLTKGSSDPNKNKVGKITKKQLEEVAKLKIANLTAASMPAAMRTVAGSAKSMGILIEE